MKMAFAIFAVIVLVKNRRASPQRRGDLELQSGSMRGNIEYKAETEKHTGA